LRIVEAELVFEMGLDLPAAEAPFDEATVWGSIAAAFAGIEICDSRFSQGDDLSLAHLVADNSNADRLVVGERIVNWQAAGLPNLSINLVLQSGLAVDGSPGRVLGHPVKALTWLANWLGASGEGLRRGQLVASGTCTGITEAATSDHIVAVFGAQAKVSVEFESEGGTGTVKT
jgi:2-keto-4-pentenoate hydratase